MYAIEDILVLPFTVLIRLTCASQAWGYTWGINVDSSSSATQVTKLEQWVKAYPELGIDVLDTLSAISDLFADTTTLEKRYGIVLKKKNPVSVD